jgi:hypothetical protein
VTKSNFRSKIEYLNPNYKTEDRDVQADEMVRLIVKTDDMKDEAWMKRRYANLFEKQRLVLKSLYEIRRNRINNRSIIVTSDLNHLLQYDYNIDIKNDFKSLKEIERMLEMLSTEMNETEENKIKNYKRSKTITNLRHKNANNNNNNNQNTANVNSSSARPGNMRLNLKQKYSFFECLFQYKVVLINFKFKLKVMITVMNHFDNCDHKKETMI